MEWSPRMRPALLAASPVAPPTLLLFMLTAAALVPTASGNTFIVGGEKAQWASDVNYTEWAANQRFFVGDWLVFSWQKGDYDVVQVTETDYSMCMAAHPIAIWSGGGNHWAIKLNKTGPWYFICSRGYCWSGMKVTVNVEPIPGTSALAPFHHRNAASRYSTPVAAAVTILVGLLGLVFSMSDV